MRLSILDNGHRTRAKLFLGMTSAVSRVDSPDIVKTLLYRPEFFSRPLLAHTASAMRGLSFWTAGEREFLAMSTAKLHECPFCIVTHAELVRIAGHGEIDPDDAGSARPELIAVRDFLETVTRTPDQPGALPDLPEEAVRDGLRVALVWNVVNRLANAFGFVLREGQLHSGTRSLHRFGYKFPGFLLSGDGCPDTGDAVADLRAGVLTAPAVTDPALRTAAANGGPLDEPWHDYAATVRDASYRVSDADVEKLRKTGHSEDEVFEVTVAAAVGAALRSHDAGLAALTG